ncbi:hypothetical protein CS8_087120 [Cupriavidus sp. 8B]
MSDGENIIVATSIEQKGPQGNNSHSRGEWGGIGPMQGTGDGTPKRRCPPKLGGRSVACGKGVSARRSLPALWEQFWVDRFQLSNEARFGIQPHVDID